MKLRAFLHLLRVLRFYGTFRKFWDIKSEQEDSKNKFPENNQTGHQDQSGQYHYCFPTGFRFSHDFLLRFLRFLRLFLFFTEAYVVITSARTINPIRISMII